MNRKAVIHLLLFPLLSGIIYALSWLYKPLFFLQLVALIPFFISINYIRHSTKKIRYKIGYIILAVTLFRIPISSILIVWLFAISPFAMPILWVTEIFFLSLGLCLLLIKRIPFFVILFVFVLFERLGQGVTTMVPFYQIGYAWGNLPSLIQYYSFLGVEGGTLLLLLVNYALFQWWTTKCLSLFSKITFGIFAGLTLFSVVQYNFSENIAMNPTKNISIIHCHAQTGDSIYQNHRIALIDSIVDIAQPNSLVVLPEDFLNSFAWLTNIDKQRVIQHIDSIEKANNQVYLTGATIFGPAHKMTPQTGYWKAKDIYYNTYNVTLLVKKNDVKIRSKELFIPFFEYIPNNPVAQWINQFITNIGQTRKMSILPRQETFTYKREKFAALLCYESIFPLFVAQHAKGKKFVVVQANENWNKSLLLSEEYLKLNRANAIQVGLPIYKSSNYGFSGILLPNGEKKIVKTTISSFTLLKSHLPKESSSSFYCRISGYSYWLSGILLLLVSLGRIIWPAKKK